MSPPRRPKAQRSPVATPPTQVRPGWLLGALGLLGLAALCCAYLSLCLLFVQGQWQLLYQPGQHSGTPKTPAAVALPFTEVQFGPSPAGTSELSGWWLPALPDSDLAGTTVLYLHGAVGSLSDSLSELVRLHALGCAVFAFDYRGYGASIAGRPSEANMVEDAQRAISYLVNTRHVPATSLIVWGHGVGATIAAEADDRNLPLVLEETNQPALSILERDPRTHSLPLRLLVHDYLDASSALRVSRAPKLFLAQVQSGEDATAQLYLLAAGPKQLATENSEASIRAFLRGVVKQLRTP